MQNLSSTKPLSRGAFLRGLLPSLLLNIALPIVLYMLVKRYVTSEEVVALSVASLFPLAESLWSVMRHRRLDMLSIVVLLGTGIGLIGVLLGGSANLILIRESFFTGAFGLACLVSLLFPRPLLFYFARQFVTERAPEKLASFDATWQDPLARSVHCTITLVWGCAFVGEFLLRVLLVVSLPHALVLAIAPLLLTGITLLTILWTIAYARSVSRRTKGTAKKRLI